MTFQEFANKLFPIIGGGNTTGEFVRTLLIQITEIPVDLDEENPLEEQLGSSFKHYFNGTRQIKELAKTINPYIEVEKFISYISSFEDGAVDNIVEEFKNDLPGVTVRRHIVGGANRTLFSVNLPPRLCRTGT